MTTTPRVRGAFRSARRWAARLAPAVLAAAVTAAADGKPYDVSRIDREAGAAPALNRFHFTDRLYRDVYVPLRLPDRLGTSDRAVAAAALWTGLGRNETVELRIRTGGPADMLLRFRPLTVNGVTSIILYVNYDGEGRKFLAAGTDLADWYARAYYVIAGNLVPAARRLAPPQQQALEKRLINERKFREAALWLLRDDDPGNDARIADLVARGRAAKPGPAEEAQLCLALAQWRLAAGDAPGAGTALRTAEDLLAAGAPGPERNDALEELALVREIAAVAAALP